MPRSPDLHGAAPDSSHAALLILDLISDFEFDDGERLYKKALPLARRIAALKKRAGAAGIPPIYVNDNARRWRSDRSQLIAHCLSNRARGHQLVEQIVPESFPATALQRWRRNKLGRRSTYFAPH